MIRTELLQNDGGANNAAEQFHSLVTRAMDVHFHID